MNEKHNYDVVIKYPTFKRKIKLEIIDDEGIMEGQHGKKLLLHDKDKNEKWLLKIFPNIIDFEKQAIQLLDVDIIESPSTQKNRMHIWRAICEYTASKIAQLLSLNIPESLIITSNVISNFELKENTELKHSEDIIILDENGTESAESFYNLSERENYKIKTSKRFEEYLTSRSFNQDPTTVFAILTRVIPNTVSFDEFFEVSPDFLENKFEQIRNLDCSYQLIPFDSWINDPDRGKTNYLVELDSKNNIRCVYGIDYEMWGFSSDIVEDEQAKGMSYLTAIVRNSTSFFDPRILRMMHKIQLITEKDLDRLVLAPTNVCKFFEYHIANNNLNSEERHVLKQVETNLKDFLTEKKPKLDKLSQEIIDQIGL